MSKVLETRNLNLGSSSLAIFHASMRMLSRSDRNTVKAVAYRTGTDLYDERSGKWFYYSSKDVAHVELLLPKDAPQWAKDLQVKIAQDRTAGIQEFSNMAEAAEKRKDARIYRELEFALPKELTNEQNIKLANEFLQDQACQLGMVALPSFHFDVDEDTGEGRPHCHAIFLTRELEEKGLCAKKELSWNERGLVLTWREQLAGYVNFHLKLHGHDVRVDHRSYKDQGIDILPQPKLGRGTKVRDAKGRSEEVMRGRDQFETQRQRNVAKIIESPSVVLDIVTRQYATFMWGDVEKVLSRYVKEEDIYLSLHERLKNSADLILLKEGADRQEEVEQDTNNTSGAENVGKGPKSDNSSELNSIDSSNSLTPSNISTSSIYTTRSMLKSELSLVHLAEKMGSHQSHKTSISEVEHAIKTTNAAFQAQGKGHGLSSDQIAALHHVTKSDQLSCVIGYAGAGKSTMFKTAKEAWQASGYKVHGLAPTGRAAQNLEEIGIKSQTLHKFLKDYQEGRCRYNSKSVLILDEAGMVDVRRFNELLCAADHLGVKLVISGDGAQAQPIEAGPAFRLVTDKLGVQKMDTIIRQQVDWQREATRLFGTYETKDALNLYLDKGHVNFVEEKVEALDKLVAKGQHREVVTLYSLSRRISGNMWHSITEDLKQHEVGSAAFIKDLFNHVDFEKFKHWQGVRQSAASQMVKSIDTYRPLMKQQGVDPIAFAANFIGKEVNTEHRHSQIQELIKGWKLETPDEGQAMHVCDLRSETRKELIQAWFQSQKDHTEKSHLILTYTNKDTSLLNEEARSLMRKSGRLAVSEHIHTIKRESLDDFGQTITRTERKAFAVGERLVFTRNDKSLDVKNGTLGTVVEMDQDKLKVKIDQVKANDPEKIVSFSTNLNPYIDQGWAITIIKSQGSTADRVFKLATHEEDRNLAYVGMTRHKEFLAVFGSKLDFWRQEIFTKRLSQAREKLSSLDYLSKEEARSRIRPPARLTDALTTLGNKLESWGYTSRKSWEQLSAKFTGQEITGKEWTPHVSRTIDETIRARDMMTASPEMVSSIHTQAGQTQRLNAQAGMGTDRGSSSAYGSGGNNPGVSSSVVINQDISAFIDQQVDMDAARDMKSQVPKPVVVADQGVSFSAQDRQEKDVQFGNNILREFVHDILTNSINDKVAINDTLENRVFQENKQQTPPQSEGQERCKIDDQKIVIQNSQSLDKAGPAQLTSVTASDQESAARTSRLESGRSTAETSKITAQKETTLDKTSDLPVSPKQQALRQDYEKIRDYINIKGDDVSILDRHYRVDPEHAISFYKGLFKRSKSFAQHMAQADKISATAQKEATLDQASAVLSPKQQALHQDYEKIREYLTIKGDDVSILDRHYRVDSEHAISFYKGLFERHKSFAQHMARPDAQSASTTEIASAPISNVTKADDLIEKIQKAEGIYLNFREPMKIRTEAREQLKELYTEASKNSVVMDKLKESDPKLQARIEEHVQPQKSKSWGLEI